MLLHGGPSRSGLNAPRVAATGPEAREELNSALEENSDRTLNNSGALSRSTIFQPHSANRSLRIAKISTLPNRNCFELLVKIIAASAMTLRHANH